MKATLRVPGQGRGVGNRIGRFAFMPSRRSARFVTTLALIVLGTTVASMDASAGPATQAKTASYNITHQCTGHTTDGWCSPARNFDAKTAGLLTLKYTASTSHCTPVKVGMAAEDGKTAPHTKLFDGVQPGKSAEVTFYVPRAAYNVSLHVGEYPGGCEGFLQSWGGTMKITTTDDGTLGDLDPPKTTPKPPGGSTSGGASNPGMSSSGTSDSNSGGNSSGGGVDRTTVTPGSNQSPDLDASASPGLTPQSSPDVRAQGLDGRPASDRSSFPWWLIVLGIAAAAGLGGAAYIVKRRRQEQGA